MKEITITKDDLSFLSIIGSREYSGNTLESKCTPEEINRFKLFKAKTKMLATYFKDIYDNNYGPFEIAYPTGNDIAIGGTKLKKIWSACCKGNRLKQYAAQLMFHFNRELKSLDVGFAFGSASSHHLSINERSKAESALKSLGNELNKTINQNKFIREKYFKLFDLGFEAFYKGKRFAEGEWLDGINHDPTSAVIITRMYPNSYGEINISDIDANVSLVVGLMNAFDEDAAQREKRIRKPLTPEQYAKQAERRAMIGKKGELFIMDKEKKRLEDSGIIREGYPEHSSLISDSFGYDIKSLNARSEDIFIEVKTTTGQKEDPKSKEFNISKSEYKYYEDNKQNYKLYRVYDVEDNQSYDEVNMDNVQLLPSGGYIVKYA